MSERPTRRLTFAELDHESGIPDPSPATGDEFPIPAWYRSIRNTPVEELTIEDVCKALRQRIHLTAVVPEALAILKREPLAGEMYDGELLASLSVIDKEFWGENAPFAETLRAIIAPIRAEMDSDLKSDIQKLLSKLNA